MTDYSGVCHSFINQLLIIFAFSLVDTGSLLRNNETTLTKSSWLIKMFSNAVEFIKKYAPTASLVSSVIIGMYQFTITTQEEIRAGFKGLETEFVYNARQVFYLDKEYALKKQLEKMDKDPDDLKTTDIELMYILCHDEFGIKYIPSLPVNRKANAEKACEKLTNLYINRTVY